MKNNRVEEPLDEADVKLAIKIHEIVRRYDSLGAFFEHEEKERLRRQKDLCAEQNRRIFSTWKGTQ